MTQKFKLIGEATRSKMKYPDAVDVILRQAKNAVREHGEIAKQKLSEPLQTGLAKLKEVSGHMKDGKSWKEGLSENPDFTTFMKETQLVFERMKEVDFLEVVFLTSKVGSDNSGQDKRMMISGP